MLVAYLCSAWHMLSCLHCSLGGSFPDEAGQLRHFGPHGGATLLDLDLLKLDLQCKQAGRREAHQHRSAWQEGLVTTGWLAQQQCIAEPACKVQAHLALGGPLACLRAQVQQPTSGLQVAGTLNEGQCRYFGLCSGCSAPLPTS